MVSGSKGEGFPRDGDAFADLNAFHAGNCDDIAGNDRFCFVAIEAAESVQLCDFRGDQFAIELADAHFLAAMQSAIENAGNRDAAEKFAVIQVGDLQLKHAVGIAGGRGNLVYYGFKERQQIL